MKVPSANGFSANSIEGERKNVNSELWHACAGPLVSLPPVGSLVVYFPQGHSEQVAASMNKEIDSIPSYPSLPSKLICVLLGVTLHADVETDEVYAQMTLQPVNKYDKERLLASEMGLKQNKQPAEFFCKTLTASDTSTHGGFSVPRRAAEKIFPPLNFTMQPPAQELVVKDLHDVSWTFRHIYRGQPKRHLLTTGWSVFVNTKRLFAGDSVLFIRDEKSQLLLGIRRANRQQPALTSSVLSSHSMHIGILAAAAHAAANNSPFTIFYNPRTSPSEFVVPLAKYHKTMYTQVSLGMRFRMMFETEESGVRRYIGTITAISDLDPVRWKNSLWRNIQVGWDESTATERRTRVSVWEIEPVTTPFYICPPPFFRPRLLKQPGMSEDESDVENAFKRAMPWLNDDFGMKGTQSSIFPGLSLVQWMAMQQNSQSQAIPSTSQPSHIHSISQSGIQDSLGANSTSKILNFQTHPSIFLNLQFQPKPNQQTSQPNQFQHLPLSWSQQQQQNSVLLLQQQQQQNLRNALNQDTIDQKQNQSFNNQFQSQIELQNQNLQLPTSHSEQQKPSTQFQQSQAFQSQLPQQILGNNITGHQKPSLIDKVHSNISETHVPSFSTSVSPPNLPNRAHEHVDTLLQECPAKPEARLKRESEEADQLDASSATSFCLEDGVNEYFPFSPVCLDGDVQIGGVNNDGLLPVVMMSRGFGSGFANQRDVETEISTAAISSQSFGVLDMSFRPGCSNDAAVNENGIFGRAVWANQPQRMRTYTKVQKRGSVGRSIDVTRYKGYDELRHDLACMFGIEGLEDPYQTDWKLVYVDHENDILLVGDDPWEEFVTCVQSIKILLVTEVQHISLNGELAGIPMQNQRYDDNSAASFHR